MDKSRSSVYDKFVGFVEQLRNTECSQKQKIACFQQIAECIMSPSLAGHINYAAHCGTATNVLLLFCEDVDSVVRMSAEENLNKILRALEKTRVSRILMDLYGEIKRNGNQRSLRICLNLFSYYAPQIKEKHIKWYAVRLLQCMTTISQRKETLLQETLSEFVKHFGRYLQQGLSDSESCKLFETFLDNIGSDCAVKRRCSAQNCISLIEHARNKSLMARHGVNKVMELLLTDQQTSSVLGALGLLRLLLPQLIRGYSADSLEDSESLAGQQQQQNLQKRQQQQQTTTTSDCRQIIEIYDYCLHLLSTQPTTNHAIINATLEVINGILQALDAPTDGQCSQGLGQSLRQLLCNQQLQHNEYLRRRKSLKNQIFQLKNYEVATSQQQLDNEDEDADADADELADGASAMQMKKNSNAKLQQAKCQQQQQQQQEKLGVERSSLGINAGEDATTEAASSVADEGGDRKAAKQRSHIRNAARSISECVAPDEDARGQGHQQRQDEDDDMEDDDDDDDDMELLSAECDDFTTLSQLNEQQQPLSAALRLPATTATTITAAATTTTAGAAGASQDDKLIDVDADVGGLPKPQHQSSLQNLLAGSDDKSQHLSDIDNESFNSIDFEAEITIAGSKEQQREQQQQQKQQHPAADDSLESGDATAIGTFFNNLLSHSNAASESVSKLFRQSSASKSTPSKSAPADKSDAASTASLTLSLSSLASSGNLEPPERQPSIAETPTPAEDSCSMTASHTASTALMMDAPAAEEEEVVAPKPETPQLRGTPNANPFLAENSPLRQTVVGRTLVSVKIGSILEQPMLHYTARLVAARFLLSGQAAGLQPDSFSRVSIKSLSLAVVAHCVRLAPRVLQLSLEISDQELQLLEDSQVVASGDSTQASSPQSSDNSQLSADKSTVDSPLIQTELEENMLLLDIKDDHFGPSTCPAYLQPTTPSLSRSADASVLLLGGSSPSRSAKRSANEEKLSKSEIIGSSFRPTVAAEDVPPLSLPPRPPKRTKSTRSRAGLIGLPSPAESAPKQGSQALSDVLLFHDHCDPILRGGVQQVVGYFLQSSGAGVFLELRRNLGLQHLLAILLKGFEDEIHTVVIQALNAFDKIFPHVVSKYLTEPPCHYHAHQQQQQRQKEQELKLEQDDKEPKEQDLQRHSSGQQRRPGQAQTFGQQTFAREQDNALSSRRQQQRGPNDDAGTCAKSSSATDNDELLAALLNDFQLQSTGMQQQQQEQQKNSGQSGNEADPKVEPFCVFAISPKLLLSKLRLCHHNKYWLVQNKYAEVISNLNYVLLRSYYANFRCGSDNRSSQGAREQDSTTKDEGEDIVCTYEAQFLAELLHLLGDDDARVREHAACCLCRFIMQTARQDPSTAKDGDGDRGAGQIEGSTSGSGSGNVNVETQQTNFNLLWDFFDYRIFGSMSVTLRNLFRASSTIVPPLAELDALPSSSSSSDSSGSTSSGSAAASSGSGAPVSAAAAYFAASYGIGIAEGHVFSLASAGQRQIAQEEKVLAKVLYRLTNKLMTLNDKNVQFGIIYALRLLLRHFNFVDYQQTWLEFNFVEICISYAYYNNATAADLSCQNDLIDVMGKLMAGALLSSGEPSGPHLDFLLRHSVKMLNVYFHLATNQRPPTGSHHGSSKPAKSELFAREPPAGSPQAMGYFAGDYVYMKLYNVLRGANDSYKITINHEAGSLLICLLKTCLNALSLCLEAMDSGSPPELKLIEEVLHYLTKLINYAPAECVACLRQLLKYLFAQNYASQVRLQPTPTSGGVGHHASFIRPFFAAKGRGHGAGSAPLPTINSKPEEALRGAGAAGAAHRQPIDTDTDAPLQAMGMLFVQGLQPASPPTGDCVRLIKLFEPLVIYCLTLFMKSNALVQAPILQLLSQLLELNVTYSILDSKNVIFDQILSTMDLIESGIDRNAFIIVPPMLRFLVQLTHKSVRQLITIPKIISITNNLLANGSVREVALLALKTLSYELFFMHSQLEEALDTEEHGSGRTACQSPLSAAPTPETREALLAQRRELDTQREVVLGMLEKFIEARPSQQVLALLLLFERSVQELDTPPYRSAQDADAVYGTLCRGLASNQWRLHSAGDLRLLESCFRNNGNHVLADSKGFLQLLQLFVEQGVGNFGDLALATVVLANVILKTEEIYLVNHIKLYLKNNPTAERRLHSLLPSASAAPLWKDEEPSTSSAAAAARAAASASSASRSTISEINYFAKVLSEKLLACLDVLLGQDSSSIPSHAYAQLAARFVDALQNVCCRSRHKDALQSVFRLVLAESEFLCKFHGLLLLSAAGQGGSGPLDAVLLASLRLLLAMRLEEPATLLEQAAQLPLRSNLQRAVLREVCRTNVGYDWSAQQVRRLFDGRYLNFLIADHLEFLCELCQERPECGSLLQVALLRSAHRLSRPSIRIVLRLLGRLCEPAEQGASGDAAGDADATLQALQLLSRLHQLHEGERSLQLPVERMARRLSAQSGPAARSVIYERLVEGDLAGGEDQDALRTLLLKDLECRQDNETATPSRIIDESWLFAQLIKFATQHPDAPQQQRQLMLLLLEIQSEPKLQRLLRSLGPEQEARLLRHAIAGSLDAMLTSFRQKCIQHAPHINYMQPPPLARVSSSLLLAKVSSCVQATHQTAAPSQEELDVARAVATLMACTRNVERTALVYIDARLVEKFVAEQLLRPEHLPQWLAYLGWLTEAAKGILDIVNAQEAEQDALGTLLATVDALLQQPRVWRELNASGEPTLRCQLLELLDSVARCVLQDSIFHRRHRQEGSKAKGAAPQAVFLAKLIETQIEIESLESGRVLAGEAGDARLQFAGQELARLQVPLSLVASIGISLLRTHQFYAYAVTPHELILRPEEQPLKEQQAQAGGKLPTIPVDCLSDVDVLRQFVKRLSIFGFTTRQQFEEYFMTSLLLINRLYDEHMVDQQEQFQIKQVCLQAILELLMTYKTFPIVGQAGGQFHHTTRWQRITCDSISLKKLHKVQLLVDANNVFYHPNLERELAHDNVIGTRTFAANQYDLNFSWAQMEAQATGAGTGTGALSGGGGEQDSTADIKQSGDASDVPDMAMRNYRHFTQLSGIDFRSSTQLVFDVLQQMIELNHILVLPNLVKFCEICESRDHVKWIRERCLKLQEQVAMDDTISHQHIIYLLCRSQALLIPSLGELQVLCSLIGNIYLKSTHCFIRIATLQGLLCLLESCSKTNTTMGRLSEELALLRALIVGYINRHGIIDESPLPFSAEHTKLVWTLNYSLIEWTSKFVPQCHLLSNTIIAANNFLKTTVDEELYLCVLHGLERLVVSSGVPSPGVQPTGKDSSSAGDPLAGADSGIGVGSGGTGGGGVVVTPQMRHKIEKLALELLKMENEKFSIPALKLLLSCMYVGSAAQLENTELSNGIVQDDPEIIAQQNDKVDILLHCIKSSTRDAAWIYGQVLCQIIRDLVPPNEILTKVIKEFLAINQPHGDVIAMIVYQVFRSAIDSSYLQMLQDWLICTLPTFLDQPEQQGVWGLSVIFLSASINLHLIKLFPLVLGIGAANSTNATATARATATSEPAAPATGRKLGQHEIALFVTAAQDFHAKLSGEQRQRFREAFSSFERSQVYGRMLQSL